MEPTKLLRARTAVDIFAVGFAVISLIAGISAMQAQPAEADAAASGPTTTVAVPGAEPDFSESEVSSGIALVPEGGADLRPGPDQDPDFTIHEGLALSFTHRQDDWLFVTTNCNDTAWVDAAAVEIISPGKQQVTGNGFDVSEAVVVLDPGHGDRDWGGVGPSGLSEKEVNLDIADRVRTLMQSGHNIDWASGQIAAGSDVPAFRDVVVTRSVDGPNDGDFEANLTYRASLATAVTADAFVSIHNNTVPRIDTELPGSEVFYSTAAEGSDRLAGIIYEELLLSFSSFDADWKGGELPGARARLNPETDEDYYGLLRRATVPAVIVEGVYISEPEEEALLATEEFRQAYADAVYRGVVRFLTTDDSGAEPNQPEYFYDDAGTVSGDVCVVPEQP